MSLANEAQSNPRKGTIPFFPQGPMKPRKQDPMQPYERAIPFFPQPGLLQSEACCTQLLLRSSTRTTSTRTCDAFLPTLLWAYFVAPRYRSSPASAFAQEHAIHLLGLRSRARYVSSRPRSSLRSSSASALAQILLGLGLRFKQAGLFNEQPEADSEAGAAAAVSSSA